MDDTDHKFVGLANLKSSYESFVSESNLLTNINSEFGQILSSNLNT